MKNKAINTLGYTGIVTLSQYNGSKKIQLAQIHNTGGASLFTFLANCLIGDFTYAKTNWPTKIKILERVALDESATEKRYDYYSASGFIFLRTTPEIIQNNLNECRVRYSFMVPRDLLENVNSSGDFGLGLYTHSASESSPEDFAAYCSLSNDLNVSMSELATASLLVDWELVIANNNSKITNTASVASEAANT